MTPSLDSSHRYTLLNPDKSENWLHDLGQCLIQGWASDTSRANQRESKDLSDKMSGKEAPLLTRLAKWIDVSLKLLETTFAGSTRNLSENAEKCWSKSWRDQQCLDDIFFEVLGLVVPKLATSLEHINYRRQSLFQPVWEGLLWLETEWVLMGLQPGGLVFMNSETPHFLSFQGLCSLHHNLWSSRPALVTWPAPWCGSPWRYR